jgi:hypothetical protein
MTDSVLAIILIVSFVAVAALVRWFKTLDADFFRVAATPLTAGLVCGVLLRFVQWPLLAGVILTVAALYVRLNGDESEPSDGMLMGALIGAGATVASLFGGGDECLHFAGNVLAGSVAGYGITFAALHVADRWRQFLLDAVTAVLAAGAASVPALFPVEPRAAALFVAGAVPFLVLVAVFQQWRSVRAELRHEASLGFIDDADVRSTAHPFLRLGRGGWLDGQAHRAFVRVANRLALRKRQQRGRPDEVARLYQLEIIKLRMHMQEMSSIDRHARRSARARAESSHGDQTSSDTIRPANEV